jgi:hypothetical protein
MVGKLTPDDRASASLLPAIMGLSKYASPNDALLGCIRAIDGLGREDIGNEAMQWGNTFEPAILKEAAMRLGLDNLDISHDQPYHHASLPLSCSLDGTAFGRGLRIEPDEEKGIYVIGQDSIVLEGIGVLEAKLTANDVEDSPPLWRGPLQLQAQMDIMGSKWGAICTLYRGTALRIYLFAPHLGSVAAISEAVTTFQNKLDTYRETKTIDYYPPIDSNDANRTWGSVSDEDNPMPLGDEEDELVADILAAKETIKLAEARISKSEAQIKAMMRDRALAMTPRYDIRWPMRSYKAQPARIVPAKEASSVRQSTLTIKERKK